MQTCVRKHRGVETRQLERGSKPGADAGQLECENTPSVDKGLFKRGKTRLVVSTQASSSVIIYLYQGIGSRPTVNAIRDMAGGPMDCAHAADVVQQLFPHKSVAMK